MERAVYQQTPQALPIEDYLAQAVYGPYLARQAARQAAVPPEVVEEPSPAGEDDEEEESHAD